MFTITLVDLIRGLRANKDNQQLYIQSQIQKITQEIKTTNIQDKATAIQKLAYLVGLGYDMQWANFHIIELLSSTNLNSKRIAYMVSSLIP